MIPNVFIFRPSVPKTDVLRLPMPNEGAYSAPVPHTTKAPEEEKGKDDD